MRIFDYHKNGYTNEDGSTTWTEVCFSIGHFHFWFTWKGLDDDNNYVKRCEHWLFVTSNKEGVLGKKLQWWWNLYQWNAPKWKFWRKFQAASNGVTFYRIANRRFRR